MRQRPRSPAFRAGTLLALPICMYHAHPHHRRERNGRDHVRTIEPELLHQHMASKRPVVVLDVRSSADFRQCHIHGATSIPLPELLGRWGQLSKRKEELLVVVSRSGGNARLAGLELEFAGFTEVRCLEGGIDRWVELRLPVERSLGPLAAFETAEPAPPSLAPRRP
jgi:rhodanese-related sulfurtransferase